MGFLNALSSHQQIPRKSNFDIFGKPIELTLFYEDQDASYDIVAMVFNIEQTFHCFKKWKVTKKERKFAEIFCELLNNYF